MKPVNPVNPALQAPREAGEAEPHTTSVAVWDVPSPVVMNCRLKVKVGVTCSATCYLGGQLIEIRDEAGARVGEGRLGETPWPGTGALYVAEVDLAAPATEGVFSWSATFAIAEPPLPLPHDEACATFSFRTVRPPDHHVTVRVTDKDSKAPLQNVEVRLGFYRALTDQQGQARLELPGGRYDLDAWKTGCDMPSRTLEVGGDLTIDVEAVLSPEKSPDDEQVWM